MTNLTVEQKSNREMVFAMLIARGHSMADYVRPMALSGKTRQEVIAHFVEMGFLDEQIDGALIELGVR